MGRVYRPKYAYTRADGTRVEKQTEAWYIEYGDASGRWIRRKAGITKEQAQDALRKAEAEVLSSKNGLEPVNPSTRLCRDLLSAYLAAQKGRVSRSHYRDLGARLGGYISGCRCVTARDLDPCRADDYLNRMQQQGNLAARTVNKTISMMKSWVRWCVRARLLPYNPLEALAGRRGEVRHQRRPLTTDEIGRLLAAALEGPARRARSKYGGGGPKPGAVPLRAQKGLARKGRSITLAYRLMLTAGLRLREVQ